MSLIKGPLLVVAAVIESSTGEVLMAQRPTAHKIAGGTWEFPGGKIEAGERPEVCLKREIFEELGVEIDVKELIGLYSHVYKTGTDETALEPHVHIVLAVYRARLSATSVEAERGVSKFKLDDVQAVQWCPKGHRPSLQFAAADVEIVDTVWASSASL